MTHDKQVNKETPKPFKDNSIQEAKPKDFLDKPYKVMTQGTPYVESIHFFVG